MDIEEKVQFIITFMKNMEAYFIRNIERVPENWDGIELRQWISDKMKNETYSMARKRKSDYNNEIIIRNL